MAFQAFALVLSDGTVQNSSGNIDVRKEGPGNYYIDLKGQFYGNPAMTVTPISQYRTAAAVVMRYWATETVCTMQVSTGFTDKSDPIDVAFYVIAMGS